MLTVSAETTWLDKLFHVGIITRLVKLNFLKSWYSGMLDKFAFIAPIVLLLSSLLHNRGRQHGHETVVYDRWAQEWPRWLGRKLNLWPLDC